jgi:hypothetical protein
VANYKVNNKSTVKIKSLGFIPLIDYPKEILSMQKWDGSFGDSVETAQAIWQLSMYGTKYSAEIIDALAWLKSNRDDKYKCWPSTGCTTRQTAKTLVFLNLAKLNETLRIKEDATAWLEGRQNYITGTKWKINIDVIANTNCTLSLDSSKATYEIFSNATKKIDLSPKPGTSVDLTCGETASMWIEDNNNRTVVELTRSDSNYYRIPGPCWGSTKWQTCSLETTIYSGVNNITKIQKDEAIKYLESQLILGPVVGRYIPTSNDARDNAFYFRSYGYKKDVENYLIFKQNNDGSFGEGTPLEKAITTEYVIWGLNKTDSSKTKEVINDAKKWLYGTFSSVSLDKVEAFVIYFFANARRDKVVLKVDRPLINISDKAINVTLFNPNPSILRGIKIRVIGDINGKIIVGNITNVSAYREKTLEVSPNFDSAGKFTGFIQFNISSTIIAKVPVVISKRLELEANPEKSYSIAGRTGRLSIPVSKSNAAFSCSLDLGSEISVKPIKVAVGQTSADFEVTFANDERKAIERTGLLTCVSGTEKVTKSLPIKIQHYPSEAVYAAQDSLDINEVGKDAYVILTNSLNEQVTVSADLKDQTGYLLLSDPTLKLSPNGKGNITIRNLVKKGMNASGEAILSLKYLGQTKEVPINVNITYKPVSWKLIMSLVVILAVFGGLAYLFVYIKKHPEKIQNAKSSVTNLENSLPWKKKRLEAERASRKEETRNTSMEELIKIMKGLGKGDKQITERLKQEGMTGHEIELALKNVDFEISGKQEIAKEKNVLKVIKALEDDQDTIRAQLKQKGFSDEQITQTLDELDTDIRTKEKDLSKKLGGSTQDEEQ